MFTNAIKQLNPLIKHKKNNKKGAKIFPLNSDSTYILNFDGASKGNPGLSGAGMVIYKNGKEIWHSCKFLGKKTNNQSEYSALILGLKGAIELEIMHLTVLGDSLLVINQVNGLFKVKSEMIADLYKEVCLLKAQFTFVEFNHVYREFNKRADELSNLALLDIPIEKTFFEIQEFDDTLIKQEEVEEIKLDNLLLINKNKNKNKIKSFFVKLPSVNQTSITDFFKINPL